MQHRYLVFIAAALILGAAITLEAENWPQFRGIRAGIADDDPALPDTWSATENVAWKIDIPGRSWSSPIVWGDHIFVVSAINTAGDQPLRPTSEYVGRSVGGTMTAQDLEKGTTPLRWVAYDIDFKTGKVRWQREMASAVPAQPRHQKNSYAAEPTASACMSISEMSGSSRST
jgi:putative pyrroloquinoline-quinone-binding quinoprotein